MLHHARNRNAAADEDRIRLGEACQCLRRPSCHQTQCWNAQRVAVVFDMGLTPGIGLHRYRPATGMRTHPFDANGTATGAAVPKQLARHGCEPSQGQRADVPLGQLAVVSIELIGKTGCERQALGIRVRYAFNSQQIQIGNHIE